MFVKIKNINYFITEINKPIMEIYNDIFARMNKRYISHKEKREIISEIKSQVRK